MSDPQNGRHANSVITGILSQAHPRLSLMAVISIRTITSLKDKKIAPHGAINLEK